MLASTSLTGYLRGRNNKVAHAGPVRPYTNTSWVLRVFLRRFYEFDLFRTVPLGVMSCSTLCRRSPGMVLLKQ